MEQCDALLGNAAPQRVKAPCLSGSPREREVQTPVRLGQPETGDEKNSKKNSEAWSMKNVGQPRQHKRLFLIEIRDSLVNSDWSTRIVYQYDTNVTELQVSLVNQECHMRTNVLQKG